MKPWSYSPTDHHQDIGVYEKILNLNHDNNFISSASFDNDDACGDSDNSWKMFSLPEMILIYHQLKNRVQIEINNFQIVHDHMNYFKILIRVCDLMEGKIRGLLYCTTCKQVLQSTALGHFQNADNIHSSTFMNDLSTSLKDLPSGLDNKLKVTQTYLFKELFDASWINLKIGELKPTDHPIPYIQYQAGTPKQGWKCNKDIDPCDKVSEKQASFKSHVCSSTSSSAQQHPSITEILENFVCFKLGGDTSPSYLLKNNETLVAKIHEEITSKSITSTDASTITSTHDDALDPNASNNINNEMINCAYFQLVDSKVSGNNNDNINTEEEVKNNPLFFQASMIYDALLPLRRHDNFGQYLKIIKACIGDDNIDENNNIRNNSRLPYILFAKDLVPTIIHMHLKTKSKNFYKLFGTSYYNDAHDGYYGSERLLGPICNDSASQYALVLSKFLYFISSIGNNTSNIRHILKELYSFDFDDTTLAQLATLKTVIEVDYLKGLDDVTFHRTSIAVKMQSTHFLIAVSKVCYILDEILCKEFSLTSSKTEQDVIFLFAVFISFTNSIAGGTMFIKQKYLAEDLAKLSYCLKLVVLQATMDHVQKERVQYNLNAANNTTSWALVELKIIKSHTKALGDHDAESGGARHNNSLSYAMVELCSLKNQLASFLNKGGADSHLNELNLVISTSVEDSATPAVILKDGSKITWDAIKQSYNECITKGYILAVELLGDYAKEIEYLPASSSEPSSMLSGIADDTNNRNANYCFLNDKKNQANLNFGKHHCEYLKHLQKKDLFTLTKIDEGVAGHDNCNTSTTGIDNSDTTRVTFNINKVKEWGSKVQELQDIVTFLTLLGGGYHTRLSAFASLQHRNSNVAVRNVYFRAILLLMPIHDKQRTCKQKDSSVIRGLEHRVSLIWILILDIFRKIEMFFSSVLYPSGDCNLQEMNTKLFIKNGKAMDRRHLADHFRIKLLPSFLKVPIDNRTLRQVLKLFGENMSYTLDKVTTIMESLRQPTNSLMNHTSTTGVNNYCNSNIDIGLVNRIDLQKYMIMIRDWHNLLSPSSDSRILMNKAADGELNGVGTASAITINVTLNKEQSNSSDDNNDNHQLRTVTTEAQHLSSYSINLDLNRIVHNIADKATHAAAMGMIEKIGPQIASTINMNMNTMEILAASGNFTTIYPDATKNINSQFHSIYKDPDHLNAAQSKFDKVLHSKKQIGELLGFKNFQFKCNAQRDAIVASCANINDLIVILRTGGGKNLVWLYPILLHYIENMNTFVETCPVTIVVVPTVAVQTNVALYVQKLQIDQVSVAVWGRRRQRRTKESLHESNIEDHHRQEATTANSSTPSVTERISTFYFNASSPLHHQQNSKSVSREDGREIIATSLSDLRKCPKVIVVMIENVAKSDFRTFVQALQQHNMQGSVVIDEAHFVKEINFRSAYNCLQSFISSINGRSKVICLSATLPPGAVRQVMETLILSPTTTKVIRGDMNRPNMRYQFISVPSKEDELRTVVQLIKEAADDKKIMIFMNTIAKVDEMVENLLAPSGKSRVITGRNVHKYHSKMLTPSTTEGASIDQDDHYKDTPNSSQAQTLFQFRDSLNDVIVCTSGLTNGFDDDNVGSVIFVGPPHSVQDFIQASSRGGRGAGNPPCDIISVCHEESSNKFFHYNKVQAQTKANGASLISRYEEMQMFWRNFRDSKVCVRQLLLVLQTCDSATNGYCSALDENEQCHVCSDRNSISSSNENSPPAPINNEMVLPHNPSCIYDDASSSYSEILDKSSTSQSFLSLSQSSSAEGQSNVTIIEGKSTTQASLLPATHCNVSNINKRKVGETFTSIEEMDSSSTSSNIKRQKLTLNSTTVQEGVDIPQDSKTSTASSTTVFEGDNSAMMITTNVIEAPSNLFNSGSIVRAASKSFNENGQNEVNVMIHDIFTNVRKNAVINCYTCFMLNTPSNPDPHLMNRSCLPTNYFKNNRIPYICLKSLMFHQIYVGYGTPVPCCQSSSPTHLKDRFNRIKGYCCRCSLPNKDHNESIIVSGGTTSSQHGLGAKCSFLASSDGGKQLDAEFVFGLVNLFYLACSLDKVIDAVKLDIAKVIALNDGEVSTSEASFFGVGSSLSSSGNLTYTEYCNFLLKSHPHHRNYMRISFLIKEIISIRSKGRMIFKES